MRAAANLCTFLRLLLAPFFAWQLAAAEGGGPSGLPLVIFATAALSDLIDGPLARAGGKVTWRGRLFDHGADAVFLFPGLAVLASCGRVTPLLPFAALAAFGLYGFHGWRRGHASGGIELGASLAGAAAGVGNYVVAGAGASALWLLHDSLDRAVYNAALVATVLNLVAALEHAYDLRRPGRHPARAADR